MDDNKTFFTQVQAPVESESLNESLVKLQRNWVFWENYDAKTGKLEYSHTLKQILKFNEIIKIDNRRRTFLENITLSLFRKNE
jgi:hypothetical protein